MHTKVVGTPSCDQAHIAPRNKVPASTHVLADDTIPRSLGRLLYRPQTPHTPHREEHHAFSPRGTNPPVDGPALQARNRPHGSHAPNAGEDFAPSTESASATSSASRSITPSPSRAERTSPPVAANIARGPRPCTSPPQKDTSSRRSLKSQPESPRPLANAAALASSPPT